MAIQTVHFSLPETYGMALLCRPGDLPRLNTYCLGIRNGKLQQFDNGRLLPPDTETDLRKIVSFFRTYQGELFELAQQGQLRGGVERIQGPVNRLIEKRNKGIGENQLVTLCDHLFFAVTCCTFSYKEYCLQEATPLDEREHID